MELRLNHEWPRALRSPVSQLAGLAPSKDYLRLVPRATVFPQYFSLAIGFARE